MENAHFTIQLFSKILLKDSLSELLFANLWKTRLKSTLIFVGKIRNF